MPNLLHPQHSSFYLGEEDEEDDELDLKQQSRPQGNSDNDVLEIPKLRSRIDRGKVARNNKHLTVDSNTQSSTSPSLHPHTSWPKRSPSASSASSSSFRDSQLNNAPQDVLQFPIESSHAYSYAHLSPNSLALRLNVLKRSLEILKDRPELFKSINNNLSSNNTASIPTPTDSYPSTNFPMLKSESLRSNSSPHSTEIHQLPTPSNTLRSMYKNPSANNSAESYNNSQPQQQQNQTKLQSNASSAALAALFRPPLQRSGSLPINTVKFSESKSQQPQQQQSHLNQEYNQKDHDTENNITRVRTNPDPKTSSISSSDVILNDDLKDIIAILQNDSNFVADNSEVALNLHQLSLASSTDQNRIKKDIIINKLLYALATPFVENSVMTPSLLSSEITASTASTQLISPASALNLFAQNQAGTPTSAHHPPSAAARPFHSMTSGKHALPQSVFTVDVEMPWNVKAANDLACLMFGISKNMIKSLTLMDLIAPQFRSFVSEKISSSNAYQQIPDNPHHSSQKHNNIIFAGEIVAILRPGDNEYAWTSVWAKRRGNMIICMFDQILCDAFDMVVSKNGNNGYQIDSVKEVAGKLVSNLKQTIVDKGVSSISESIDEELNGNDSGSYKDGDIEREINDSNNINDIRYFTLQLKSDDSDDPNHVENVPCAVTSDPIEGENDRHEIKIKIHTLPYIAGIFVINASNSRILSCNNAIAKNLFGRSSQELDEQSIDVLIPSFSDILQIGLDENADNLSLVPGLVLPEHFFRKYDAVLRSQDNAEDSSCTEEDLFFNSKGIEGVHRDGKPVWVDVQLRASTAETFVLWITYSRQANNIGKGEMTEEIDKLSNNTSSLSLYSGSGSGGTTKGDEKEHKRRLTDDGRSRTEELSIDEVADLGKRKDNTSTRKSDKKSLSVHLPSQMNLFSAYESDLVEMSSGSDISRKSSTRRLRTDSSSYSLDSLSQRRPNVSQEDTANHEGQGQEKKAEANTRKSSSMYSNLIKSDAEIIALENEMLAEKIKKSTEWPSVVGAKRRTKKFSEFKVLKDMGEGAYGKVVLAQHKEDPEYKIIIKCIDKERILVDTWVRDRRLGTIPSEINIMAFLNTEPHPNIMRIIDFFEDSKYYYLETPLFGDPPAIDLFDFIEIKKNMTEDECKFIFKQVTSALYHLHKNGIVHRDIKDENVIVDENGIIKLIDFGSAGYAKQGPFDVFVGTIDYASPEVLRGERYDGKPQDIWALGILLYTMIYKENPFYNVDEIMEGDLRIPFVLSEMSENLIKKILVREIDQRPTIADIVEDPWLEI